MDRLVQHALNLLKSDPDYLADARQGVAASNTIIGSIMSITTNRPRWATELAVADALTLIDESE